MDSQENRTAPAISLGQVQVVMQKAILEYKPSQLVGPPGRVARKLVRRQLRRLAEAGFVILEGGDYAV